jgi:hypothetical protein
VAKGPESSETYKTKKTTRHPNSQASRYTNAQKEKIATENSKFLHFFGYASAPQGHSPNPTGYFEFGPTRSPSLTDAYYQFRQQNAVNLQKVTKSTKTQTFANHGRSLTQNNLSTMDPSVEIARRQFYPESDPRTIY